MLKNVLIVVDDIEKSIEFYKDLFGLQVILKNEGNVILSEQVAHFGFPARFVYCHKLPLRACRTMLMLHLLI